MSIKSKSGLENPAFQTDGDTLEKGNGHANAQIENGNLQQPQERAQWGNDLEFLMSCIAMSVGLGNVWRFPFTAKQNGSGAFLIPYIVVLTVIGRPLYYMEMTLGQFSSRGSVKMYAKLSPVLKGIGYGQIIGAICVATYYCCLMAITLIYLINSFTSDLPWTECFDSWSSYLEKENKTCVGSYTNLTNITGDVISSAEVYFKHDVLHQIDDISDGIGTPDWKLTLSLLGGWAITLIVSIKGVQSSGKFSYFLAIFPYIIMITLLIRAATLDGAGDGMYYFIETDWAKLGDAEVWYAAVTQCFFSLNVGFGSVIMYSSYNNFNHNINRDALVVTTIDTFTSLLSGATIFGILGNLAYVLNVQPENVIGEGGTNLAFISYPQAIGKFDAVPWLFAILFFFMLLVLGIGSLVALHGSANTVIKDAFPNIAMWKISSTTAVIGFLIGLIYVTPGGQYMLDLVDHFGGTFIIFIFVLFEVTAVSWLYGIENLCLDLEFMTKKKVSIYWRITWAVIMPVLLIVIFIYFLITRKALRYGVYRLLYPAEIELLGWLILAIGSLQMIMWVGYYLYAHREYPFTKMIRKTFSTNSWGPDGQLRYDEWKKFREDKLSERAKIEGSWLKKKIYFLFGLI